MGGGGGFNEWRRKDGTYKGVHKGVNRDTSGGEGGKMWATGRGTRWQKRAHSAGLHGLIGTWRSGRGHNDRKRRDGRWGTEGLDACVIR